jgi:hypothetical protein
MRLIAIASSYRLLRFLAKGILFDTEWLAVNLKRVSARLYELTDSLA